MTGYQDWFTLLRWLTTAGMAMVCARLLRAGLYRRYPVFFVFLIFSSLRSGALMALNVRSGAYMKLWMLTEPVLWVFYLLLVLELYSLILEHHKGLYLVGRWAVLGALPVALLFALLSLAPPSEGAFDTSRLMGFYMLFARGLQFSLVVFLLLMLAFLSRFPVQLTRNVLIHSVVYSLFFMANSLTFLARGFFGWEMARPVNMAVSAGTAGCMLAWAILLGRGGEARARAGFTWQEGSEERLLGQLDSLNAAVLRVARK